MLSIVIPTLNEEKFLPRLLNNIKEQRHVDYEVIVSDGGSKDKTTSIAKEFGCRVFVDKKRSPARQRNNGANITRGDTILFLDADTELANNFLFNSYNEFKERNLNLAGFYLIFNSHLFIYRFFEFFYHLACFLGQYFFPASVGVGIMVRSEDHQKVKGFDESIFIGEDYDYIKRLSKIGRYRMIRSSKLYFSVRRLEKEGVLRVLWKWFRGSIYFIIKGPIRKKIVDYKFGEY